MLKGLLLFLVAAGLTLTLTGCGHWGCWGDHSHHASDYNYSHSHYRGCGHSGY